MEVPPLTYPGTSVRRLEVVGGAPWRRVLGRLRRDRAGLWAAGVLGVFFLMALGVWLGWWGQGWSRTGPTMWAPASGDHWFGTNLIGQDIYARAIASSATAFEIGVPVAVLATAIGGIAGALAGFHAGRWVDGVILWLAGVVDSVPFFLFVAAVAYALQGAPGAMQIAMISAFWTTTARLVRAEVRQLRGQPFVEAARALGLSDARILFRHLLPNTGHILLVQVTLSFVAAVKAEVILSFLGLGLQRGVSWGVMLAESTREVLAGQYNNFLAASAMLLALVLAVNLFADSLQEALDPRGDGHE